MANIETKTPAIIVPVPSDVPLFTRLTGPSISQFDRLSSPNNPATNYVIWENRLESALTEMNIWDIISGERTRPTDDYPLAQKAWDKDDSSARNMLTSKLEDSEVTRVTQYTTSFDRLRALRSVHLLEGPGGELKLFQKLMATRIDVTKDIQPQLDVFVKIVSDIRRIGGELKQFDHIGGFMLLQALPLTLDYVVSSISKHVQALSITSHENAFGNGYSDQRALAAISTTRPICYQCQQPGHIASSCPNRMQNRQNGGRTRCWNYTARCNICNHTAECYDTASRSRLMWRAWPHCLVHCPGHSLTVT